MHCRGPIPDTMRKDAKSCSKRCRQALKRFRDAVGIAERYAATPLRLAYADPPYPGLSRKYYGNHRDFAGEVDHAALIEQLQTFDGWALSTSAAALQSILALCPPDVSVAAWHRGERPTNSPRSPQCLGARDLLRRQARSVVRGRARRVAFLQARHIRRRDPNATDRRSVDGGSARHFPAHRFPGPHRTTPDDRSPPRDRGQAGSVLPVDVRAARGSPRGRLHGPVPGVGSRSQSLG